MEPIKTYCRRRYRHNCAAHAGAEQTSIKEICPDCGQRGEFDGFNQSMIDRMSRASQLYGFPSSGVQLTYLPKMTRVCERCRGDGIAKGEDFDYECPDCAGTGGFWIRTTEETAKIRRWALARHHRMVEERGQPRKPIPARKPIPTSPVFSNDIDAFVEAMMQVIEYNRKYSERNRQIGELILPCDDHGWDVFMEMVELWDTAGGEIEPGAHEIQFLDSTGPGKITLAALYPPGSFTAQRVWVNAAGILQKKGRAALNELVQNLGRDLIEDEFIPVDETFSVGDAALLVEIIAQW
jgi:hypothetical protein